MRHPSKRYDAEDRSLRDTLRDRILIVAGQHTDKTSNVNGDCLTRARRFDTTRSATSQRLKIALGARSKTDEQRDGFSHLVRIVDPERLARTCPENPWRFADFDVKLKPLGICTDDIVEDELSASTIGAPISSSAPRRLARSCSSA